MGKAHLFAVTLAALAITPPAALAQWGTNTPSGQAITRRTIAMRMAQFQTRDWAQCVGAEETPTPRAIGACGRIIAERVSRSHTAAAYFHRGRLRQQLGDAVRAQSDFEQAILIFGGVIRTAPSASNYFNRASVLYYIGDYGAALADYTEAVRLDADLALGHARRADILFRQHDYAGSAAAFDQAARIEPEAAEHQIGRCMARAAWNAETDVAASACENALHLSNNSSEALAARGFLRFQLGHYEEAMTDFTAANAPGTPNPLAAYGQAVVGARLNREGDRARADEALIAERWLTVFAEAGLRP